jgi:hypothetical protein
MATLRTLLLLSVCLFGSPGLAQDRPRESDEAAARDEIVVIAPETLNVVGAAEPPIVTLDEADIAAYGAASLTDLVAALAPQTGSGRGRGGGFPVILFNGQRISNFREFRNIPPEAIRKVEVLPEEVALRYGFPPNQRVINFILKDNFASKSFDAEFEGPDRGGFLTSEYEASLLRISKASRFNLNLQLNDSSMLTEAERGVIQQVPPTPGAPDPAEFRSLVADSRSMALTGSWSAGVGKDRRGGTISANGSISRSDSRSLLGIDPGVPAPGVEPIERFSRTVAVQGGAALNTALGRWQLTLTGDGGVTRTETRIERRAPIDVANIRTANLATLGTLSGSAFRLPGGDASLTLKAGYAHTGTVSRDTRTGGALTSLDRDDFSAGFNLAVPITSRRENFGAAIGDLSFNFSAGLNQLSDFGTLTDWSTGLTWKPIAELAFQASYFVNQAAPSLADLGNPLIVVPNVPVYDFARNETALATITSGGNPFLRSETQRDLKLGINWELPGLRNSNLLAEYFRNRSDDVTAAFPVLTPEIEAAFPGRVTRDLGGRLVAIDRRPVTFAETRGERLRWGFNVGGTIGKAAPGPMGAGGPGPGRPGGGPPGGRPPGGGSPGGGRPGGGGGGGGGLGGPMLAMLLGGQGRWSVSLYHTWRFAETVLVAPGGPALNLLDGDALTGGGVARHALEFEGGAFHKGFGLRFNGSFTAPTRIEASGAPGTSDLRFGSLLRIDLRAFVNFDQQRKLVKALPFLKGARLLLVAENLLDQRQKVTDSSGAVPLGYQPDYLDPRGRFLGLDFRKLF